MVSTMRSRLAASVTARPVSPPRADVVVNAHGRDGAAPRSHVPSTPSYTCLHPASASAADAPRVVAIATAPTLRSSSTIFRPRPRLPPVTSTRFPRSAARVPSPYTVSMSR